VKKLCFFNIDNLFINIIYAPSLSCR